MAIAVDERAPAGDTSSDHARLQLPADEQAAHEPAQATHAVRTHAGQGVQRLQGSCQCEACAGTAKQGETLSPVAEHFLELQRTVGNRAVVQMLRDDRFSSLTSGVQRLAVTDSLGTRELPGYHDGPDAFAEGEAQLQSGLVNQPSTDDDGAAEASVDAATLDEPQVDIAEPAGATDGLDQTATVDSDELQAMQPPEVAPETDLDEPPVEIEATAPARSDDEIATNSIADQSEVGDLADAAALGSGIAGPVAGRPDSASASASVTPPNGSAGVGSGSSSQASGSAIELPKLRPAASLQIQRLPDADVDTGELDDIDLSTLDQTPESSQPDTSAITSAADGLDSARPTGGGGVIDAAIDTAMGYLTSAFTSAVSMVRSGTSSAQSDTEQGASEAASSADGAVEDARGQVSEAASTTAGDARQTATTASQAVSSEVSTTRSFVRGIVRSLGGAIRPRIQAWLQTAGSDEEFVESIVAPIRRQLQQRIEAIQRTLATVRTQLTEFLTRTMASLTSITDTITSALMTVLDTIQTAITALIERIRSGIQRVIDRAVAVVRDLPSIVWQVISGLVNRVANAVRRIVNLVANAAQRVLNAIFEAIRGMIQYVRDAVVGLIERLLNALMNVIDRIITMIESTIQKVVNAIQRAIVRVRNAIRRIVRSVMQAVMRAAKAIIEDWLRPQIEAARAQARAAYEEFQKVLPQLRQLAEDTKRRMEQTLGDGIDRMTDLGGDAIDSLLNPDGDHFSIGEQISVSGFLGAGAVVGADVTGSFVHDFVADYAHKQVGIFATVSFSTGGHVGVGTPDAAADIGVTMGWGTQHNLGSKDKKGEDIESAVGGDNATLGIGAGANVHEAVGVSVNTGHSFSMSLDTQDEVVCPTPTPSPTPTSTPTSTPTPTPTPTPPPTPPPEFEHHPLTGWTVHFPTGSFALDADDLTQIGHAASAIPREVARHEDAAAIVNVDGHSSPRWRRPGAEQTAESENQSLSGKRATEVTGALRARMPDVPGPLQLSSAGRGDELARNQGAGPDSDDQGFRIATISGEVISTRPGTGSLTTGGGGHTPTGGAGPVGTGASRTSSVAQSLGCRAAGPMPIDDSLRSRPYGWDTTMGVSVGVGAGAEASASMSVGLSRTFTLWKSPELSGPFMSAVRLLFGLFKLGLDVVTASPVSFVRDAISIAPAVEEISIEMLMAPITALEIALDFADG